VADYPDQLSETLAVLHDLLLSEHSQHTDALAPSNIDVRAASIKLVEELSEALESRAVIDQARGMLMTGLAYDAKEAFDLLESVSQDSNEELIVIAQRMVDSIERARKIRLPAA
jgi:AmiR/NasT family two-component response regulator